MKRKSITSAVRAALICPYRAAERALPSSAPWQRHRSFPTADLPSFPVLEPMNQRLASRRHDLPTRADQTCKMKIPGLILAHEIARHRQARLQSIKKSRLVDAFKLLGTAAIKTYARHRSQADGILRTLWATSWEPRRARLRPQIRVQADGGRQIRGRPLRTGGTRSSRRWSAIPRPLGQRLVQDHPSRRTHFGGHPAITAWRGQDRRRPDGPFQQAVAGLK